MKGWQHFTFADLPVSPWRNGGGETRQIISFPPDRGDFDWRASIATIAQDGPFSAFPGIDRSITLLSGKGVHLQAEPDVDHFLGIVGEPYVFSGDIALSARLLSGVTTDFNMMTRRNVCTSRIASFRESLTLSREHGGVIYVICGNWQLPDGSQLVAEEGFFWSESAGDKADPTENLTISTDQSDGLLLWAAIIR